MNERRKAFCGFYLETLNATESALRAGYSKKTAYSIGQELLKNIEIKEYINKIIEEKKDKQIAKADEVLITLTKALRGEIEEEVITVVDGVPKKIKKQIQARERIKAAELLGKRYLLFTEKQQLEVTPIIFTGEEDLEE